MIDRTDRQLGGVLKKTNKQIQQQQQLQSK